MARYEDLCADFIKNRPRGPISGEIPWFNVPLGEWRGNESTNDVLIRHLKNFGMEYLCEAGTVWFLYRGLWKCSTREVKDGKLCFCVACFDY